VRIARAARSLRLRTAGVFAPDDRDSAHMRTVDAVHAVESYLDAARLVSSGRDARCTPVHPGYGFLSEKPCSRDGAPRTI
jgi:acetyl/propionyl-CoA carboxylase alpha subunit